MLSEEQHARLQAGVQQQLAERYDSAAGIYAGLLAEAPDDFQVNHLFGVLRQQQGRPAEAVPLLEKARAAMPLSASTHMCYGLALGALGRRDEAERALCTSVGLDSRSPENWANLGALYATMGRPDDAMAAFRRALALKPDYASGWTGLGSVLQLCGRSLEAIECHSRALEIDPRHPKALFGRAQALQACQRPEEALADFDAHLALRPRHHEARSFRLFLLNYRCDLTREQLFAEHLAYGRAVAPPANEAPACRAEAPVGKDSADSSPLERGARRAGCDASRRLRVAFLSPDLRTHSVSFFLEPLLRHLDRGRFKVVLYHDHYSVDAVSDRLRGHADLWRHVSGLAHPVVGQIIRADAPDVLVDLAGHTGFNRMELLARRLAPVQVSFLGYPNTTGLDTMDARLTDAVADPLGEADALHAERLVRFAPCAWVFQPWPEAPEPSPAPSPRCRGVTFASFNALAKVNAATLDLWRRVLEASPGSRLLLKSSGMDEELWRRKLLDRGYPQDRFDLLPMAPSIPEHLDSYGQVDVALDPFPYNGTTTTCEALWMGVPVVTLAGDRHAARVGASLLSAVGHPEWAAASAEEYVRIAAGLAAAAPARQAWRTGLREEMRRSPLFDYAGYAERFGAALAALWNERASASHPVLASA